MQKIQINKTKCIGCGICQNLCPEGFQMVGDKAEVKNENADCVKQAAASCPTQAIITSNSEKLKNFSDSEKPSNNHPGPGYFGPGRGQGFGRGQRRRGNGKKGGQRRRGRFGWG